MKTNLLKTGVLKGRLYSHALVSVMLIAGLAFAEGDKKSTSKKSKAEKDKDISWAFDSYKIKSTSVLTLALPNMVGSGQTQLITGCYNTGNVTLYQKGDKGLKMIRNIGKIDGSITDIKLLSMGGAQNKAIVAHEEKGSLQIFDLKEDVAPLALFHGPHGINTVEIADLNGDGLGDIIPVSFEGRTEVWFENHGDEGFVKRKLPIVNRKVTALEIADFDLDGDQDLLIASDYAKMIRLFTNDGNGNFTRSSIEDGITGVLDIEVLDMDMNGKMDVAYASHDEKRVQLLLNKASGFERKNVSTKLHSLNNVEVFDLGKDGRPDLIITSFADDAIRVIENSASGLKEHQFQASIPAPTAIVVKADPMSYKTTVYVSSMAKNRVYSIDVSMAD